MRQNDKFLFAECKYKIFRKLKIIHSVLSHFTYITHENTILRTFLRQFHYKPDSYTCSSRRPSCWGPVSSKYGTRESTEYIEHHEHPLDMSIWSLLSGSRTMNIPSITRSKVNWKTWLSIRRGNDCRTASRIMHVAHGLWLGLHYSFYFFWLCIHEPYIGNVDHNMYSI